MLQCIKLNLKIVSVLNSCDRKKFEALVDTVIDQPKVFRSKWYIWNWIRGRDFYKMLAHYVVKNIEAGYQNGDVFIGDCPPDENPTKKAEAILQMVLDTAKDEAIKRNFIWAVMKQIPLLTVDTVQYASREKVISLLQSNKVLVTDPYIGTFVDEIGRLRNQIHELEDEVQMYKLIADEQ